MAYRFPAALAAAVARAGISHHRLAKLTGVDQPTLVGIAKGRRKVPTERIEQFADALQLTGRAREDLMVAGWLDHSPAPLADLVDRLRTSARTRRR